MTIKVDKGVPIPDPSGRHYGAIGSILRTMEVGESFVWPMGKSVGSTRSSAAAFASRLVPKKFIVRTVLENGARAVRVWRVE